MENVKKLMYALFMLLIGISISSCSDDDNENTPTLNVNVIGTWECIETTGDDSNDEYANKSFSPGTGFVLFDSYYSDYEIKGFKCFNLSQDDMENHDRFTVEFWDEQTNYWMNIAHEPEDLYTIDGNILSIIEADYDRHVGTVEINGDIMTYTYKYQNWTSNEPPHLVDESCTYVSKFKKK